MISVIIPVYNSRDTIIDCIKSVINQTRYDLIGEILIVDDGSQDGSSELVNCMFPNNTKLKILKKINGGVSSARNLGIKKATGDWIALLDSDDCWKPQKIEAQWDTINRFPDICFIGTNRNDENCHRGKKIDDNLFVLSLKDILISTWPHTSTVLIKKTVFDDVGGFNEKFRYSEDAELWNRIALKYKLYYIPVSYEVAGGNKLQFGERGLSANLVEMHKGTIRNIKELHDSRIISNSQFVFLSFLYWMKYQRRRVITFLHKKGIK